MIGRVFRIGSHHLCAYGVARVGGLFAYTCCDVNDLYKPFGERMRVNLTLDTVAKLVADAAKGGAA